MSSPGTIISLQIKTLSHDYFRYNSLLKKLQSICDKPIQADLAPFTAEEGRLGRKIISCEKILARWLEDIPSLEKEFEEELKELQVLRGECRKLRDKGRSSLKTGLTLLDRERGKVKSPRIPKSFKKETAPRLIDIEL
ncbi:MAG: hypothetical protein PQJ50_03410 [Spirochaetales bacterium]|nr:hypothetical protein [Spirochaetales bacterium]